MPKVLRIINRFNLGGPTFNAALLTKHLPPPFETLLVGGKKENHEDSSLFILDELGIDPVIIPEMERSVQLGKDRKALAKIREIIRDYQPDIVHTHASKAGALGRMAALKENVPITVHTFHGHVFHSYFGKFKTEFYRRTERYLAKSTDAIIAISEIQKKELSEQHKICPPEKIRVIPLGFDLSRFTENQEEKRSRFREDIGAAEADIVITIVGRMVPVKNHKMFVEAVSQARDKTEKRLKVVIVGDGGKFHETVAQAQSNGWSVCTPAQLSKEADMHFLSWRKDVDVIYAGSDIVALSSLNEGTPVSLIEAQAAGKPIVTTDVGGVRDVVGDGGIIVPSDQKERFSEALLSLVEDEDRQRRVTKGKNDVLEHYHYSRLVKDISRLYNNLLREKRME